MSLSLAMSTADKRRANVEWAWIGPLEGTFDRLRMSFVARTYLRPPHQHLFRNDHVFVSAPTRGGEAKALWCGMFKTPPAMALGEVFLRRWSGTCESAFIHGWSNLKVIQENGIKRSGQIPRLRSRCSGVLKRCILLVGLKSNSAG